MDGDQVVPCAARAMAIESNVDIARSPRRNGRFRVAAKSLFITYPRCDLSKEVCLELLQNMLASSAFHNEVAMREYCIGRETHQDGGFHLHVFVTFDRKLDIRSARTFDMLYEGIVYHGNIQSVRNRGAVMDYVRKGGDYIENVRSSEHVFERLHGCTSAEEVMKAMIEEKPRDWYINGQKILENWELTQKKNARRQCFQSIYPRENFCVPQIVSDWMEFNAMRTGTRSKLLILCGGTCLGKTAMIRAICSNHGYFRESFNIRKWDDAWSWIVFDDCDWDTFPAKKPILCAMGECEITDKYVKRTTLIADKPAIWICNELPMLDTYWQANTIVCLVNERLY